MTLEARGPSTQRVDAFLKQPVRAGAPVSRDACLQVPAMSVEVARIRHAVLEFAKNHGIASALLDDIALAVSEACSNVVMHAYRDATTAGLLSVEMHRLRDELVVVVSDRGSGIAPRADSPGIGMGLALIARLAHRFEIATTGSGATLTMRFAAASG
jgi:anti-sigma regulatory factor (Ser/Thr protein kinase)